MNNVMGDVEMTSVGKGSQENVLIMLPPPKGVGKGWQMEEVAECKGLTLVHALGVGHSSA